MFSEQPWTERLQVQAFRYPQVGDTSAEDDSQVPGALDTDTGFTEKVREAHAAGIQEGESRAKRNCEKALQSERQQVQKAIEEFRRDCDNYYQLIEAEVVQLALSIARKVLHRESQVDPMLLAGIVRVALKKLENDTHVKLVLSPVEAAKWRESLRDTMDAAMIPEVEEDSSLPPQRCIIKTVLAKTELGIEPQLKEIENGLMDVLANRPKVRS